ncbi:hypothetical protein C8Q76DRAFT_4417 [Earliella scabrosa]|nr:hypothetical protein C8Q76DRAFT_4417 [Earliella scabrosa]
MHAKFIPVWDGFIALYSTVAGLFLAGDLVLTGTLIILLLRGRASFRRMGKIVNTLIRYTLCATLLFSVGSVTSLVLLFLLPHTDALRERDTGIGVSTILAMSVFHQTRTDAGRGASGAITATLDDDGDHKIGSASAPA